MPAAAPDRPPPTKLTPEQVATIERVWLATANASEAARRAGCSERSARRYILRRGLPKSAELYAQALAREEQLHLATVRQARRKVRTALKTADKTGDIVDLTRAANDSLRSVTATRIAHLKVTGLAVPERHEHSGPAGTAVPVEVATTTPDALHARLAALAARAAGGADAGAARDPDGGGES